MKQKDRMTGRGRTWLLTVLADGPRKSKELYAEAELLGINRVALGAAMRSLNIVPFPAQKCWYWKLV
jgi:hypothetical protein